MARVLGIVALICALTACTDFVADSSTTVRKATTVTTDADAIDDTASSTPEPPTAPDTEPVTTETLAAETQPTEPLSTVPTETVSAVTAAETTAAETTAAETTAAPTTAAPTTAEPVTVPPTEAPTVPPTEAPTTTELVCAEGTHPVGSSCIADPTTTTTLPTFDEGTYLVPDEISPGLYRVGGYWARLDAAQNINDNDIVYTCPSVVSVEATDAYLELGGPAVPVSLQIPFDPFTHSCTDGTFVVGLDILPGRYRVTATSGTAYYARLKLNRDIIDNDLSEGSVIAIIRPGDVLFQFSGTIEALP